MPNVKKQKKGKAGILAVFIFLLILVALILHVRNSSSEPEVQDYSEGISQIHALEAADPNTVDQTIKEYQRQAIIDERDARFEKVDSGEITIWSLFNDYLIIGDSRAANFTMVSELDSDRNLGRYGNTLHALEKDYDTITAVNPAYLIVVIGLNDIRHSWINSTDDFYTAATNAIQELKDQFPNIKIFINPIFPVIQPGLSKYAVWNDTAEYDAVLQKVSDEIGVYYVNCDNITMQDSYYRDDGIHFNVDFMTLWAKNIITTIYNVELNLYTSADDEITNSSSSTGTTDGPSDDSDASTIES